MGLKDFFKKLKEENRNMGTTTARINSTANFYGNVNRRIKDGDFWNGSYVSIEAGHGVIYGSAQDDYTFAAKDIAGFELSGAGQTRISVGNAQYAALSFVITFCDGKKAYADIIVDKVDAFKAAFEL